MTINNLEEVLNDLWCRVHSADEALDLIEDIISAEVAAALRAERRACSTKMESYMAKIAEMESQKPVGTVHAMPGTGAFTMACFDAQDIPVGTKLYALPGAQPAPSINEGVRKVTLDFRWESEAQHHIPTIEIEFDPVSPDSPNDAKSWKDRDRIASMLSPEAKP